MRILDLGDSALTVEFAAGFDDAAQRTVVRLDRAIAQERCAGRLNGVVDTVPTFRSLSVHYDPLTIRRSALETQLRALIDELPEETSSASRSWRLPVVYGGDSGPDLAPLADAGGLTSAQAIERHAGTPVQVYMLGFLPGFPFMGDTDGRLRQPRLSEPRTRVPAGSVAVTGRLTAVYPWESPGGWHLIGRCPVRLFDVGHSPPALLAPGDSVTFEPCDEARIAELERGLAAGELTPDSFREQA